MRSVWPDSMPAGIVSVIGVSFGTAPRPWHFEHGSSIESWPVAGGRRYVTVTTVLQKRL